MSGQQGGKALTIRELPRSDRPRERLVDLGASALSSAELLAILLGVRPPMRAGAFPVDHPFAPSWLPPQSGLRQSSALSCLWCEG